MIAAGTIDAQSLEQSARERWTRDAAIRAEFGEFERYLAWRRAAAQGSARIQHHEVLPNGDVRARIA